MTSTRPRPPAHLAAATLRWWQDVVDAYDLNEHHVRLLTAACEAWDRAAEARERIAKDGAVVPNRWGELRAHPSIAIERDSRIAFARLMRELRLDDEPDA